MRIVSLVVKRKVHKTSKGLKTASQKTGAMIHSLKFLSAEVALYLYKLTIHDAYNTVVRSKLVPLAATWNR